MAAPPPPPLPARPPLPLAFTTRYALAVLKNTICMKPPAIRCLLGGGASWGINEDWEKRQPHPLVTIVSVAAGAGIPATDAKGADVPSCMQQEHTPTGTMPGHADGAGEGGGAGGDSLNSQEFERKINPARSPEGSSHSSALFNPNICG